MLVEEARLVRPGAAARGATVVRAGTTDAFARTGAVVVVAPPAAVAVAVEAELPVGLAVSRVAAFAYVEAGREGLAVRAAAPPAVFVPADVVRTWAVPALADSVGLTVSAEAGLVSVETRARTPGTAGLVAGVVPFDVVRALAGVVVLEEGALEVLEPRGAEGTGFLVGGACETRGWVVRAGIGGLGEAALGE